MNICHPTLQINLTLEQVRGRPTRAGSVLRVLKVDT
jgi:hypothetical protein